MFQAFWTSGLEIWESVSLQVPCLIYLGLYGGLHSSHSGASYTQNPTPLIKAAWVSGGFWVLAQKEITLGINE